MRGPRHSWAHRRARTWYATRTTPGTTPCAYGPTCTYGPNTPIGPHWDLAHNDNKPGTYLGPAHPKCNRSRHKQSPHTKNKQSRMNSATINDRETQRRKRINERETQRQQRQQRRTIITPSEE